MTERLFSKRTIYALCGLMLMLIDWSRNVLPGAYWAGTMNCIGVVVGIIAVTASYEEYNKPFYYIWTTIMLLLEIASYQWWLNHQAAILRFQLYSIIANIWFLGYPLVHMASEFINKKRKLRFSKTEIPFVLLLLCMFFSVNEDVWPLWFLLMYFILRQTDFSDKTRKQLLDGLVDGIILSFFWLQGRALLYRPFDHWDFRYQGIYSNANINALFYLVVWVALVFRLFQLRSAKASFWKRFGILVLSELVIGFAFLTMARIAWLVLAVLGIFYFVLADIIVLRDRAVKNICRVAIYLLLMIPSVPAAYSLARYGPTVLHQPIMYEGECFTGKPAGKVEATDPPDSEKYVTWEEYAGDLEKRANTVPMMVNSIKTTVSGIGSSHDENNTHGLINDMAEAEQSADSDHSASVRLQLWEYYLSRGTLFGHSNQEGHDLSEIGFEEYTWHPHNAFIQIWYWYGIVSAILFLLCAVQGIVVTVRNCKKKNKDDLFALMCILLFLVFGTMEQVLYRGQMVLTLALLSAAVLITGNYRNE